MKLKPLGLYKELSETGPTIKEIEFPAHYHKIVRKPQVDGILPDEIKVDQNRDQ